MAHMYTLSDFRMFVEVEQYLGTMNVVRYDTDQFIRIVAFSFDGTNVDSFSDNDYEVFMDEVLFVEKDVSHEYRGLVPMVEDRMLLMHLLVYVRERLQRHLVGLSQGEILDIKEVYVQRACVVLHLE